MRIAGHHQGTGNHVTLFHHHLMRNAGASWVKVDAVLASKLLDVGILLQVLRRDILNVVIDRENRLGRIRDRGRPDLLELGNDGAGVIVRHHMARPNRNEISSAHHRSRSQSVSVACGNFFDEREPHYYSSKIRSARPTRMSISL